MSYKNEHYLEKDNFYYDQSRDEMLSYVPVGVNSVLDVGCSSGAFGRLLKEKRGCEVWGIEPTDSAIKANKVLDRVFHDVFHQELDLGDKKFDAIIFNDVLEHLADPWGALSFAKELLTVDGCIVASIPNLQCYSVVKDLIIHGEFQYQESGILDKTHLRFFTKKSIHQLFSNTGYDIITIAGQNSVVNGSRFLRMLSFFTSRRFDSFYYVNFALCAKKKKAE